MSLYGSWDLMYFSLLKSKIIMDLNHIPPCYHLSGKNSNLKEEGRIKLSLTYISQRQMDHRRKNITIGAYRFISVLPVYQVPQDDTIGPDEVTQEVYYAATKEHWAKILSSP
jgi:hypothetical protein